MQEYSDSVTYYSDSTPYYSVISADRFESHGHGLPSLVLDLVSIGYPFALDRPFFRRLLYGFRYRDHRLGWFYGGVEYVQFFSPTLVLLRYLNGFPRFFCRSFWPVAMVVTLLARFFILAGAFCGGLDSGFFFWVRGQDGSLVTAFSHSASRGISFGSRELFFGFSV